jgi:hypothetical protein
MPRILLPALGAALALALSSASADEAPTPVPAASAAEREEVKRLVDGLRDEAARIRGLPWKFAVPADLVTRAEMRAAFLEDLDTEYPPEKRARDTAILRRLGLLTADQDPVTMMMDFMEAGVAGYYDPRKKHLRIVEGLAGPEQQPTILHELIHALEDQHYDLEKRTKPFEEHSDRLFAEKCITEGSAEHARELYEAAHPELAEVFARAQNNPEMAKAQMKAFAKVPAWMFVPTLLHYEAGPAFASQHVRGGAYPERIHALYQDPPVSQEQILHPERWFGAQKDYPQAVVKGGDLAAAAGAGWKLLHELPQGELDLSLTLDFFLGPTKGRYNVLAPGETPFRAARKAAAGWDAGWAVVLEKQGLPLVLVDLWAFDTEKDAWEAAEQIGKAAERAAGKAWLSRGWTKMGDGEVPQAATLSYLNQHGASRLVMDGTRVLRVDGAPLAVLESLWPVILKTSFTRDPRDTWVPGSEGQAFAQATWKDEQRGVGLSPPAGWRVVPGPAKSNVVAIAQHDEQRLEVQLTMIPRALPVKAVLAGSRAELLKDFPDFTGESLGPARIGDAEGTRVALGTGDDGRYIELAVASGSSRFYAARVSGPSPQALDAARAAIEELLAGVVSRVE